MARLNRVLPLNLPGILRYLGPLRYDAFFGRLEGHSFPPRPFMHGEKFSFKPTKNFEFGFSRTAVFAGQGLTPLTFDTLLHTYLSTTSGTGPGMNLRNNPGARFGGFDFSYRIPGLRNWLTLYTDSAAHDDVSPISAPRRASINPGLYLSHFPGLDKLDLRLEGVNTDPPTSRSNNGRFIYYEGFYHDAYTNNHNLMSLHQRSMREFELLLKRLMDIAGSVVALISAAPLMFLAGCAIYLEDRGPIFYRSLRVGKKGKTFQCLKFRTMVVNADKLVESLQHLNERDGILFKISNDPRITRIGRWLRKYSIDEVPQFWNVLKGEMSLVGPRPPLAREFEKYELEYFRRLDAVPGITGLWQVEARQSASFSTYINLDLHYVEHWSLLLDLKLLFKTIAVVFAGTGR